MSLHHIQNEDADAGGVARVLHGGPLPVGKSNLLRRRHQNHRAIRGANL